MTDATDDTDAADPGEAGWFSDAEPGDVDAAGEAIVEGGAERMADWPRLAVEAGYADSEDDYYRLLHEATMHATRREVREREGADDQQLKHAVRAMDDAERVSNELAERAIEWGVSRVEDLADHERGLERIASLDPETRADEQLRSFARLALDLREEADDLRTFVERQAPAVAPNLAEMAGPVLAARLISLAGGLESLAKKPAGTVQVLGAEDALFAHLSGRAPSPKHGAIFTHEYVRGTHPDDRGSASRAFSGKLVIAARIDHYSGDYRPGIHEELRRRIETIRARRGGEDGLEEDEGGSTSDDVVAGGEGA